MGPYFFSLFFLLTALVHIQQTGTVSVVPKGAINGIHKHPVIFLDTADLAASPFQPDGPF